MNDDTKSCCACGHAPSVPKENNIAANTNVSVNNMIRLEGGNFLMGTNDKDGFPQDGEGPVREVTIDSFYIDTTVVTNQQFAEFIKATDYKSDAERFGWSFVFYALLSEKMKDTHPQVSDQTPWWCGIPGAKWNQPEGADSNIDGRMDHPVVHVSWNDAQAYCRWKGKRLPTEAEWEYAARGGLIQNKFPWGNELTPNGEHRCNIWQGKFPAYNSREDGYLGTAPAKSYQPNAFGLYNMSGNVWEWCSDWFSREFHITALSINPRGPVDGTAKVIRGGSFLCHESYCNRYRVAARTSNTIDSSTSNMGFRCVV